MKNTPKLTFEGFDRGLTPEKPRLGYVYGLTGVGWAYRVLIGTEGYKVYVDEVRIPEASLSQAAQVSLYALKKYWTGIGYRLSEAPSEN